MRLSLSQKLSIAPLAVAVFFALLSFGYLLPQVRTAFESQGQDVGAAMPSALASTLMELLTTQQFQAVQTAIDDIAASGKVGYVAVLDSAGDLVAVAGPLGPAIRQAQYRLKGQAEASRFELDGHEVLNLHAPVLQGAAGHVHVGYNRSTARAQVQTITMRFSAVVILSLLGFSLAGLVFSRRLVAPLRQLTEVANRIAQHGDLRVPVRVESDDEVGQLARAFATMVGKLKELLEQLQRSSDLLSKSVDTLNDSANEQSQMVSRQAAALQETQVTAQEIRQTSLLASQTAESVLRVAERADELGRTGEAAISASVDGLVDLREQVRQIAERIAALSARTEQIGGITGTVKDLADQSNLLAVNAAIEAARSGEHGKGFGVVAREIRGLADQSIRATNQVREILADISMAIAATVSITEQGTKRMESGLSQVRASGTNLRELSTIVRDSASSVRQIAHTVNQQTTGIEQIFTAVNDLNMLMSETVKRISNTTESAVALKTLSESVATVVRDYRT